MMMRARRIENEGLLLADRQHAAPDRLCIVQLGTESFDLEVHGMPALTGPPAPQTASGEVLQTSHRVRVVFPRYYPSMPAEVYVGSSVFHPNVHPDTGFVCLWTRHRVDTTVSAALRQMQRVLAWELWNDAPEHVMQPEALAWYATDEAGRARLPLTCEPFLTSHADELPTGTPTRRRLS